MAFSGPFDSKILEQSQSIEGGATAELCTLRLFGDWQLKIRFTYDILNVSQDAASEIRLEPTKTRARHHEEEVKSRQDELISGNGNLGAS